MPASSALKAASTLADPAVSLATTLGLFCVVRGVGDVGFGFCVAVALCDSEGLVFEFAAVVRGRTGFDEFVFCPTIGAESVKANEMMKTVLLIMICSST